MGQQNAPPAAPTPSGPVQQALPSTSQAIAPYYVGPGQAGTDYANMVGGEYGNMQNWGKSIAPNFQQLFSNYLDVANRNANQQASQIGETLGSRGALYSSANLQQQANMRERTAQDIALQASTYQTQLEQQRQSAEALRQQGMQNVMTAQGGLATGEMGEREAAMGRFWQDYMRQSGMPAGAGAVSAWGAGIPAPGQYAT